MNISKYDEPLGNSVSSAGIIDSPPSFVIHLALPVVVSDQQPNSLLDLPLLPVLRQRQTIRCSLRQFSSLLVADSICVV